MCLKNYVKHDLSSILFFNIDFSNIYMKMKMFSPKLIILKLFLMKMFSPKVLTFGFFLAFY